MCVFARRCICLCCDSHECAYRHVCIYGVFVHLFMLCVHALTCILQCLQHFRLHNTSSNVLKASVFGVYSGPCPTLLRHMAQQTVIASCSGVVMGTRGHCVGELSIMVEVKTEGEGSEEKAAAVQGSAKEQGAAREIGEL